MHVHLVAALEKIIAEESDEAYNDESPAERAFRIAMFEMDNELKVTRVQKK